MSLPATIGIWLGIAFLGVAAYCNWRYRTVPNWLIALFLLSFFPVAWFSGLSFGEVALRCAVFGAAFLVVLILFGLRVMEGGAGKLLAVTALWLPLPMVPWFGIVCVGLVGAAYLAMRCSRGRWIEIIGEKFASIIGVVGIVLLAIAA
jgi:Flp pilus assembly protein protease CpaA